MNQLTKFRKNSRGTEIKDILQWSISHMIITTPTSTRIVESCVVKRNIPFNFKTKTLKETQLGFKKQWFDG